MLWVALAPAVLAAADLQPFAWPDAGRALPGGGQELKGEVPKPGVNKTRSFALLRRLGKVIGRSSTIKTIAEFGGRAERDRSCCGENCRRTHSPLVTTPHAFP